MKDLWCGDGDRHSSTDGATADVGLAGGFTADGGRVGSYRLRIHQQTDSRRWPFALKHFAVIETQVAVAWNRGRFIKFRLAVGILASMQGDVVIV